MNLLTDILWDIDPEIFKFTLPVLDREIVIRWYGLFFATGFLIGQYIMVNMFKREGKAESDIETLTLVMVFATVVGARLGHCLFYEPDYYLSNPLEILMIWKGGLASHGAAVGILLSLYFYSRSKADQSYLWILDRIAVVVALAGCCIRLGNLMNSEIVGLATDLPWGFIFARNGENFARHPAQLYESISCLLIFIVLYTKYLRSNGKLPEGRLFGLFMVILFSLRFLYESLKENQVAWEDGMSMNMGQILSIPLVLIGIYFLWRSYKVKAKPE